MGKHLMTQLHFLMGRAEINKPLNGSIPVLFEGLCRVRHDALRVDQIALHSPLFTLHSSETGTISTRGLY